MMSHCQICGREIKINHFGKICHHGYQRTGQGWQTASCLGALYLPYEKSCERLKEVIESTRILFTQEQKYLNDFLKSPPETINELRGLLNARTIIVHEKPDGFTPDVPEFFRGYSKQYHIRRREIERSQHNFTLELDFLRHRLENFK